MVVQIARAQLLNIPAASVEAIEAHHQLRGAKFLVLDNTTVAPSATVGDGRLVYLYRVHGGEEYNIYNLRRDRYQRRNVSRLTPVNPAVRVGDRVMSVEDSRSGIVGVVVAVHARYVQVTPDDSTHTPHTQYFSDYVALGELLTEEQLNRPPSEEDLAISPWWIDRIKTFTAREGKKRGWCSELDKVVQELLEPLKKPFYITEVLFTEPGTEDRMAYEVHTPDGVWAAQFASKDEADKYLETKNKSLPPI